MKPKADSIYTIVGAASVAAKVTRDAWIEGWIYEENVSVDAGDPTKSRSRIQGTDLPTGSGYPSGVSGLYGLRLFFDIRVVDPKTQSWLRSSLEPTFGFPSFARFSWATVKVLMEKGGHKVQW